MVAPASSNVDAQGLKSDANPQQSPEPGRGALAHPSDLQPITGWGNVPAMGREHFGTDLERLSRQVSLSRGMGRSYGDSSLPAADRPDVMNTCMADRILHFDRETGQFRAEAGLTLKEINRLFLRQGYFSPVTPGTQFVSLGGMVASDVHGKGHHRAGCFGSNHVTGLKVQVADGRTIECSADAHADLFWATIGGMGLTGHILEVEFALKKIPTPWIWSKSQRITDIDDFQDKLKESSEQWPYGVGWIDCLSRGKNMGRGILDVGRWAEPSEVGTDVPPIKRRLSVPFNFPSWILNSLTVRAFNFLYYWKHQPRVKEGKRHPEGFFYPLDAILHWNRIYGKRGFTQYQCVLPNSAGRDSARRFLDVLTRKGGASFLCVIKDCGDEGRGLLSFPMPGISIALDIAIRSDTQKLVDELNELVIAEGGRIYLTKDTFTRPEHFARMEPRLAEFTAVRDKWDPARRIKSAQSVRMLGDSAG